MISELPKLYTQEEVAAYLDVHPETVAREIRAGGLLHVRIGKKIRIRHDQLLAYLNRDRCGTTSETTSGDAKASGRSAGPTPLDAHSASQLAHEIAPKRRRSRRDSSLSETSPETSDPTR